VDIQVDRPFVLSKPAQGEAEYYAAGQDGAWQLIDGQLVMSPASQRHEELRDFLAAVVRVVLEERGGGVTLGAHYPMRLDRDWSPEPDLMVIAEASRQRMTPTYLDGPADLVVEIASDGDPRFDQRVKLPRYLAARIPEIWLISPQSQTIRVLRPPTDEDLLLRDGWLRSTVVPSLGIDIDWLWQDPLPSTMACLRTILGDDFAR
jgi:Uma2 family endonuclease